MATHDANAVKLLLEFGANPNGRVPSVGRTALHYAARYCQGTSLRLLLAGGGDPNVRDRYSYTPLSEAVERIVPPEEGSLYASPRYWASCKDEKKQVREKCKARLRVVFERRVETREECVENVAVLVRYGGNPDIPDFQGVTPLDKARKSGVAAPPPASGRIGSPAALRRTTRRRSGVRIPFDVNNSSF